MPDSIADLWRIGLSFDTVALRLGVALALGAVIGFEREVAGRAAGLRTHMLVSLAAALFTIIAFEMFRRVGHNDDAANVDPLRLIEAVTAGVAFLAAGSILRGGGGVRGVTTGAGLWLAGAIGMGCGYGLIALAALAAVLGIIVLTIARAFEPPPKRQGGAHGPQAGDGPDPDAAPDGKIRNPEPPAAFSKEKADAGGDGPAPPQPMPSETGVTDMTNAATSTAIEQDLEQKTRDPNRHFGSPMEVVHDPVMTLDQKRAVLSAMEHDALELSVAAEENMAGGEDRSLRAVRLALRQLDEDVRAAEATEGGARHPFAE